MLTEIRSRRQDKNPCVRATVIRAKGFHVSGEQMSGLTEECGFQDWPVVIRKIETGGEERGAGLEDQNLYMTKKLAQGRVLNRGLQVATGLFLRVCRRDELYTDNLPQSSEAGIGSIGCGTTRG
jgi:hypothetical protein